MSSTNYVYPHIEFNTVSIGNVPVISAWRNRIGVVGQFRRGPALRQITDVRDFNRLYGADRSPGSRAVRMMLDLGANDIIISRAVSEETSSQFKLSFYSLTPGQPAKVGYEGQVQQFNNGTAVQTTGIAVEANYIGQALPSPSAFGRLLVDPTSKLNPDLIYSGQSTIDLKVEQRISSTVDLTTTSSLSGSSSAYLALSATTFALNATGTLASLNALLSPQGAALPLVDGDALATPDGGYLTTAAGNYTVVKAGSLAVGNVAFRTETLGVLNVLARLGSGSRLYYNNVEVARTILTSAPTNNATNLIVISTGGAVVPDGASLSAQAVIGEGRIKLSPTGVNGYQFARLDKVTYAAIVANASPGKVFQNAQAGVSFPQGPLTILSRALEDPTDSNVYRIVVKGQVTGAPAAFTSDIAVALYDTPFNGYTLAVSTTANFSSAQYPTATQWRNQLYQESTRTLVDSYEIITEAYRPQNLKIDFLFVEQDGTLRAVDSGIKFDLPQIQTTGTLAFTTGSTYRVPLVRARVAAGALKTNTPPFSTGTSAATVLEALNNEFLQDSLMNALFEPSVVSKTLTPTTLEMRSRIKGDQANRIYLEISRSTLGEDSANGFYANDLLLNSSSVNIATTNWTIITGASPVKVPLYFTQGSEGSKSAFLDLYSDDSNALVRVVALSDGAYGNQIRISVSPGTDGQFVISAVDLDSGEYQPQPTSETLNLSTRDVDPNTGEFNATSNSALIRAYYLPVLNGSPSRLTDLELSKVPQRIAPAFGLYLSSLNFTDNTSNPSVYSAAYQGPAYLQGLFLSGGADSALEPDATPSGVGAQAMVRAVQRLESQDIAVLYPSGVVLGDSRYAGVVEECVGQVKRLSSLDTNRRLVLQAPPNLNQDQASLYGAQLNDEDISLVAGFCSYTGISTTNTEPTAALYAATLSLTAPPQSPAYFRNGVTISLVGSTDIPSTPQYLDALTRAGVDALFYDAGLGQFHWLNGRTTSRDSQKRYVSIRRVGLQMMVDLYQNLVQIRSAQNDSQTRALLAASCDAYLSNRVAIGWIESYSPTICDESNNTPATRSAGLLNATTRYTPFFPADVIVVDVIQDFSIQTGVN